MCVFSRLSQSDHGPWTCKLQVGSDSDEPYESEVNVEVATPATVSFGDDIYGVVRLHEGKRGLVHSGSLDGFVDFCISLLGNHVLACTSLWGCKVGNIFEKIYSFMTNGSDPLKI